MKYLITVLLVIAIVFLVAYLINPQIFRIIRYQKPLPQTYQNFPVRKMKKSDRPFHFVGGLSKTAQLDTLPVDHAGSGTIPFSEYFEKGKLCAFIVIRNDTVLYERYGNGYTAQTVSNTFSVGKSMVSLLVGKAIEEGYIKSVEQKVTDFLPELSNVPNFDKITIRHLLNMKSGLRFTRAGEGLLSDLFCDEARFYYTKNLKRDLLKVKAEAEPGTRWQYSNLDPLFLTWLLERAVKRPMSEYFAEKIWQPVGAEYEASWGVDHEGGLENSPSSFQCTAIDLAKIGRMLLMKGKRDATQIVTPEWIDYSFTVSDDNRGNTEKGWQKATHQNYWWIPLHGSEGDFAAEGMRGQRLYVHPPTNTVIVQMANNGYGGYPYRKIAQYFATRGDNGSRASN